MMKMSRLTGLIIHYHRVDAAVPPPHHSEYLIEIAGKTGKLTYWPDYSGGSTPCWVSDFRLSTATISGLQAGIGDVEPMLWRQCDPPQLGGAQEWLDIDEGSRTWKIPPDLCQEQAAVATKVYQLIRDSVPPQVWEEMHRRKQAHFASSGG